MQGIEKKVARLAAALSYYTVFSLPPLLVVVIALAGIFGGGEALQSGILTQVENLIGPQGRELIENMILTSSALDTGLVASLAGGAALLFGALGVFGELQDSLNTIWEVKPKPVKGITGSLKRLVIDRLLSFTMVLGIGFLLLVSLVITAALAVLQEYLGAFLPISEILLQVINFSVSLAVISLLFAMIFKFLPDAQITWRDVWLGSVVTALLFLIGQFAIGLYLGQSDVSAAFGAAAALAILLLWVYYSAQILLLGAEFTQVYANLYGSRIQPAEHAELVSEADRAQQGISRREKAAGAGAFYQAPGRNKAGVRPISSLPAITGVDAVRKPRTWGDPDRLLPRSTAALLAGLVGSLFIESLLRFATPRIRKVAKQNNRDKDVEG